MWWYQCKHTHVQTRITTLQQPFPPPGCYSDAQCPGNWALPSDSVHMSPSHSTVPSTAPLWLNPYDSPEIWKHADVLMVAWFSSAPLEFFGFRVMRWIECRPLALPWKISLWRDCCLLLTVFLLPFFHSFLQKYRIDMPGSNSAFIPTINAITTSQDLQWMVQPTVITSMSSPYSRSHPYGHHLTNGPGILGHNPLARPGVIRSIGDTRGRRKRDEQVRHRRRRVCCAKDSKVIFCEFYIKDVHSTLPVTLKGIKQE